jgi:hypothetical protein
MKRSEISIDHVERCLRKLATKRGIWFAKKKWMRAEFI